jgi:hypothetical protein
MDILWTALGVLASVALMAWIGLRVRPKPFAPLPDGPTPQTAPVPAGLPAPVDRFYRRIYGERVPVITSAVISGGATIRLGPIACPARFRFSHLAGQAYRHEIEVTFFGCAVMKVNEWYVDGRSRLELPFGVIEDAPKVDQGANLTLWAESIWLPTVFLTDARVRWEPFDSETAVLVVPFGAAEERFIVRFDSDTGLILLLESMRYQGAESPAKTLWLNEVREWARFGDATLPSIGALTWFGTRGPWAVFRVESVVYNVDVHSFLRC